MPDPLAGAGLGDSLSELGKSFSTGELDSMALNTVAVGLDTLGVLANPLDAMGTSAIGWLIEHISILRKPLDWTAGDPEEVRGFVQRWNDLALTLAEIADRQDAALRTQIPTYLHGASSSAPEFERAMKYRIAQIRGASMTCAEIAQETAVAGARTAATRGIIRDMIAGFLWDLLQWVTVKLAAVPLTFGAATLEIVRDAVVRTMQLIRRICDKLDELLRELLQISTKLQKLADRFNKVFSPKVATVLRASGQKATFNEELGGVAAIFPKAGFDIAKESAKVSTNELETTEESDVERVREQHERLDGQTSEPRDWWMKRGHL